MPFIASLPYSADLGSLVGLVNPYFVLHNVSNHKVETFLSWLKVCPRITHTVVVMQFRYTGNPSCSRRFNPTLGNLSPHPLVPRFLGTIRGPSKLRTCQALPKKMGLGPISTHTACITGPDERRIEDHHNGPPRVFVAVSSPHWHLQSRTTTPRKPHSTSFQRIAPNPYCVGFIMG
jgi:hypothetical protein